MKILILNGPNLGRLGAREPRTYGTETLDRIMARARQSGVELGVEVDWFQSDEEGVLVTRIGDAHRKYDGLIFNPAAYTHTSVALRDALQACTLPCVEVHLSNTHAREEFRHRSLTAAACIGQIMGFGGMSYVLALDGLVHYLRGKTGADNDKGRKIAK